MLGNDIFSTFGEKKENMPTIDHHINPFSSESQLKLELFEAYAKEWLPTFLMQSNVSELHIFDLFAGPGYDLGGIKGSPIRLIDIIEQQRAYFFVKGPKKLYLHLNELNKSKFTELQINCMKRLDGIGSHSSFFEIKFYNERAENLIDRVLIDAKGKPSLVFLDQNGVKFLSKSYFNRLEDMPTTDFIYFSASNYIRRFWDTPIMKNILPIDKKIMEQAKPYNIHRIVVDTLRNTISNNSKLMLFPFTIKKGSNYYGLIFGAKHPRAFDKFLKIAWNFSPENGEANFDIEDDQSKAQLLIFEGRRKTKLEKFEEDLINKIGSNLNTMGKC